MDIKYTLLKTCLLVIFIFFGSVGKTSAENEALHFDLTKETEATVDSLESYIIELIRKNQLTDAHQWSAKGIELARKIGYREGEFNLLLQMGSQFLDRNMPDSTIYYSNLAYDLAESDFEIIQALNSLANGHTKAGRSVVGIDLYEQVLAIADSLNDEKYSMGVLINLATAYKNQGEIEESLKYYFEALERSEESGRYDLIALISNNLGDTFIDMENYERAEHYLIYSKEMSYHEDDRVNLVRVYLNMGNLYKNTERFDEAESSYQKVLEMHRQSGNLPGKIQVTYNIGMMHLARLDYDSARSQLMKTLADSREINMPLGLYYSLTGLGELELEIGNIAKAAEHYKEAYGIAENLANKAMQLNAMENVYQSYKYTGNKAEALNWLEKVTELKDEVRSGERDRLSAQYEAKFNLRQAEQEKQLIQLQQEQQIAQLEQQRLVIASAFAGIVFLLIAGGILMYVNKKRKTANYKLISINGRLKELNDTVRSQKEELERLNTIKTKLFAIIAHDLRGPLGSLQSLLYLLREHDLSEEEKNKLTTTLEKNMLENSSMMDNLLGWAQSQLNGIAINKRSFDLRIGVESVLDQFTLQAESKNINLVINVPENTYIFADYDLMKLVIRNLVANAIKFSHNNSAICIGAEKTDGDRYEIYVKDAGMGISKENQSKIFTSDNFTSPGTNREKGHGLGLNLCKEYVEKQGGSIWFETKEGEGTVFYFTAEAYQKKEKLVNV